MIVVTGGAGFIGSNFVLDCLKNSDETIINLDKLTYAGNLANLSEVINNKNHIFIEGDIVDKNLFMDILKRYNPRAIINFAAESHVDKSISNPNEFIITNILGTHNLLNCSLQYFREMNKANAMNFRFIHVSTDEVYGSLSEIDPPFNEQNPFKPNSPYSASKASSDHLVRAYYKTYGLPVITSNCSNNYGPHQFPEKLIPLSIKNVLSNKEITLYGNGLQIRDWLYVTDHCSAIQRILHSGKVGEVYNIGGLNEKTNLDIALSICNLLDSLKPREDKKKYSSLIRFVKDRPGHDIRYAINASKISKDLGWKPKETFESGIKKTLDWYLSNTDWIDAIESGAYRNLTIRDLIK